MKLRLIFPCISFLILLLPFSVLAKAELHRVAFTTQELANIQGHYSSVRGYVYIHVNNKQVSTNFKGKYIQLIKKSDGHIYPLYKFLRIIPISLGEMAFSLRTHKGKSQLLIHQEKEEAQIVAQKFKARLIPKLWKEKLGKYKATLIKGKSKISNIRLTMKNGVLVATINKNESPYPLLVLSSTKLYSPSSGHEKDQQINIAFTTNEITLEFSNNKLLLVKE